MSRFAWEQTTKFKPSPDNRMCGAYARFTFGVTKSSDRFSGYFSCTGEEMAPFFLKYEEDRQMREHIRDCHDEADSLDEIHPHHTNDYWKIRGRYWQVISCGCLHETFARMYPSLAKYLKWHLAEDGIPMHYISNALYHIKQAFDEYVAMRAFEDREKHGEADIHAARMEAHIKRFKSHVIFDENDTWPTLWHHTPVENAWGATSHMWTVDNAGLIAWLEARIERLRSEFRHDMETLKGLEL